MKKVILMFFIIFSFAKVVFSQKDSCFIINEFSASVNRTVLKDANTKDHMGLGAGIYHSFRSNKKLNILWGLEFNRTTQFKEVIGEGHSTTLTNVTCRINSVSIPLTARINFGNTFKLFFEAGTFVDLNVIARWKGTMYTTTLTQNNVVFDQHDFNTVADIASINYGTSVGIGVKFPIAKHTFAVKSDYKLGLAGELNSREEIKNNYIRLVLAFKL